MGDVPVMAIYSRRPIMVTVSYPTFRLHRWILRGWRLAVHIFRQHRSKRAEVRKGRARYRRRTSDGLWPAGRSGSRLVLYFFASPIDPSWVAGDCSGFALAPR